MSSKGDRVEETQCAEEVNSSCGGVNLQARDLLSRSDNYSNEGLDPLGCGEGTLHIPSDKEDIRNEPEDSNDRSGTARISETNDKGGGAVDGGGMVNFERYIERFVMVAERRMKPRTIRLYLPTIRKFCKDNNLSKYARKQIKSKGREIIVKWVLDNVPSRSRRYAIAHLKSFWECGLEIDWPVNLKRDLPKLPEVQPRETPPNDVVKKWVEAMENEPDLETRAYFYGIAEHGWRSSHLTHLEWTHVRWRDEVAWAVVAQSEHFKTSAPLIAVLGPHFSEILTEMRKQDCGNGFIFPKLAKIMSSRSQILNRWKKIQARYSLPPLKPNGMRHWVSSAGHLAGLSKPALAGILGHKSSTGSMADWYNSPTATVILDEQETKLPNGMLAFASPPKIEIIQIEHKEILELWSQYLRGEIGTMEFATRAEHIKADQSLNIQTVM